jgi:RNA polymerase sigma-70 factor (ECF subfamily)
MTPSEDQQHVDFLRLYVEHEEALRGFVRALVPTREDARDVMQDVTVVLWRKIGELSAIEDFRRWAFGVARMQALTFLRDRARMRHVFGDDVLALLAVQWASLRSVQWLGRHGCLASRHSRRGQTGGEFLSVTVPWNRT